MWVCGWLGEGVAGEVTWSGWASREGDSQAQVLARGCLSSWRGAGRAAESREKQGPVRLE